jgi:hypothetical protein
MRLVITILGASALLAGCAGSDSNTSALPGGARLVAESPAPLAFTASEAGTLFVRDRTANRVAFSTRVEPGQHVDLDPPTGRLTVAGKPVAGAPALSSPGGYELFFKTAAKREYHPAYNP